MNPTKKKKNWEISDEKPLPIDPRTLGLLAEKCHAYAKALHYRETEFKNSPVAMIERHVNLLSFANS